VNTLKESLLKTKNAFFNSIFVMIGVIILISISINLIPKNTTLQTGYVFVDVLIMGFFGSFAAGNPITSYIIGGELLKNGISLIAVTAFLLTWVTVGIIQFPAESYLLGRKFAITRNITSFISAIIIAFLTIITMSVI
jgi:uncharacterized membrane protein YraQ (UPF0718 family)